MTFTSDQKGTWKATAVGPTGKATGKSASYEWIAPTTAQSVTITLDQGTATQTVQMTVVAPTGLDFTKTSEYTKIKPEQQGAGMVTDVHFLPFTVSFGRTKWKEIGGPGSNASGYYAAKGRKLPTHKPNPKWLGVDDSNGNIFDTAAFFGHPAPWTVGSFDWVIPNHYQVSGESGPGHEFTKVTQTCTIQDSQGTTVVTKGNASSSPRTPTAPMPKKKTAAATPVSTTAPTAIGRSSQSDSEGEQRSGDSETSSAAPEAEAETNNLVGDSAATGRAQEGESEEHDASSEKREDDEFGHGVGKGGDKQSGSADQSGANAGQTGAKTNMAQAPIAWAGVGETGKVFETQTHEVFVDGGYGNESVEISTEWVMAEFKSYELGTDAVLEVTRTIKMRDAHNQSVLIRSRGRTFFFADQLPNDIHAAVYAPAKSISHDGVIQFTSNDTVKSMRTMDHKLARSGSLAEMLNSEPMLGFDVAPKDRLAQYGKFSQGTLPGFERNLVLIESIFSNASSAQTQVQEYIKQKLDYQTPKEELLRPADQLLVTIRELRTYSWTGYESSDIERSLEDVIGKLNGFLVYARTVKPEEKNGWDHALDLVKAVGKAIVGLGVAVKEIGAMARDGVTKVADKIANVFGYEIEWKAWSTIGKAYEQGKSTKEIFTAVVDGLVDQWKTAFDKAGNGDYSGVMDLGAELVLDIALEVFTLGAATPAVATKRAGSLARMVDFATDAGEAISKRADDLLKASKGFIEKVPAAARRKLEDAMDALEGLAHAIKHEAVPAGAGRLALDVNTIPQSIARVRGARAMKAAGRAVDKLGGGSKKIGQSVLKKLEDLKAKMPDVVHSLAARISKPGGEKLIKALDEALPSIKKLDDDIGAAALKRAANAVDPAEYLSNISWAMKNDKIKLAARKELVRQAVMRDKPLDLGWLQKTDLDGKTLEFMALDPATNWTTFMKVSSKPSDYFPAHLKKKLKNSAYADSGAKLRGVAGELSMVVDSKNLPNGFKIEARQVPSDGKVLDFKLVDAAGNPAMLEVKSWNKKRWTKELDANVGSKKLSGGIKSMIEQLKAAKKVPAPKGKTMSVYLAVSDIIDEADKLRLGELLKSHGLSDVMVHKFSDSSLTKTRDMLRDAMALPAAGAAGIALASADDAADLDDGRDE